MLGYLFSFQGRIGRLGYLGRAFAFIAIVIMGAILISLTTSFHPYLVLGEAQALKSGDAAARGSALRTIFAVTSGMIFYALIITIFGSVATLSRQVRRLHDAGLTGWWAVATIALPLGLAIAVFYGTERSSAFGLHGLNAITMSQAYRTAAISACVLMISYLLFLLFWPGTRGENRFGESTSPLYRGGQSKTSRGGKAGKSIIATLDIPVPEDQLAMMSIIRAENPEIQKISVSPDRDRIEFSLPPGASISRRTVAKILRDFGFTAQRIEMG